MAAEQPTTDELLAEMIEAAARLSTLTELLRTALAVADQRDNERAQHDRP